MRTFALLLLASVLIGCAGCIGVGPDGITAKPLASADRVSAVEDALQTEQSDRMDADESIREDTNLAIGTLRDSTKEDAKALRATLLQAVAEQQAGRDPTALIEDAQKKSEERWAVLTSNAFGEFKKQLQDNGAENMKQLRMLGEIVARGKTEGSAGVTLLELIASLTGLGVLGLGGNAAFKKVGRDRRTRDEATERLRRLEAMSEWERTKRPLTGTPERETAAEGQGT